MKILTLLAFIGLSISSSLYAQDEEIKTTDVNNQELQAAHASIANEQITTDQVQQLKNEYEKFKENQQKAAELLKEVEEDEE